MRKAVKSNNMLFLLCLLGAGLFLWIVSYKYLRVKEAVEQHNIIMVRLSEVKCGRLSRAWFLYEGKVCHLNLQGENCDLYIPGDSVKVLYATSEGEFYPAATNPDDGIQGIVAGIAAIIILIVLKIIRPHYFEFNLSDMLKR